MITKLALTGFKSYSGRTEIKFAPITIFIGPNNSGKSAILEALLLLRQTVSSSNNASALVLIDGENDYGSYKDIVHKNNVKRNFKIEISAKDRHSGKREERWEIEFASRKRGEFIYTRHFKQEIKRITSKGKINESQLEGWSNNRGELFKVKLRLSDLGTATVQGAKRVTRLFQQLNFSLYMNDPFSIIRLFSGELSNKAMRQLGHLGKLREMLHPKLLMREIRMSSHLGPLRDSPQRYYRLSGQGAENVGSKGQNTLDVLIKFQNKKSKTGRGFWTRLSEWFKKAGIAEHISLHKLTGRHYELRVKGVGAGTRQNISDAGFGNSQVLPLVVDTLIRPPNTAHIIEQPEIHLHPKAQCELGELLLLIAKTGRQAIVETHSFELLTRLRNYIAHGKLATEDVRFYYVEQRSGTSKVVELKLGDSHGFSNWPKGFFEERYNETREILSR